MENESLSSALAFDAEDHMFINGVSMIHTSGIYNNNNNYDDNGDLRTAIPGVYDSSDSMLCFYAPCSSIISDFNHTPATRSTENHDDNVFNDYALSEVLTSSSYNESLLFKKTQHGMDMNSDSAPFPSQQGLGHVFEEEKLGLETPIDVLASFGPSIIHGSTIPGRRSQCLPLPESHRVSCTSGQGSRYLNAIHEIFSEIASDSLNSNSDRSIYRTGSQTKEIVPETHDSAIPFGDRDDEFQVQTERTLPKPEIEARKSELVFLLQIVDEQFSRFSDEIHTVISAFHAATELDPRIHARFVLETLSFFHGSLRLRIRNQIIAMETAGRSDGIPKGEDDSFEMSLVHKHRSVEQERPGRRIDHRLWKAQRGLPDRSVSVLRAWMFHNFLHPYPKDSEKHNLAVRSGLTKSQVSNWFINARVRIWKPMIEKMYTEVNKRKQNDARSLGNNGVLTMAK